MPTNDAFQGVSNCYVFKSRLQEYAQKVGVPTPVYETIKEGPSHEPFFKSAVIVNDVRYDSLPGFSNRKAAEQSAAEVALRELAKSGDVNQCISQPVHETGLCKNLLQEYAQKMNYAIPLYQCQKDEGPGRATLFSCSIEIGGIRYIGAAAKTKKEAEIKAARTALLAIQSSASESYNKEIENVQLTVLPCKKRSAESNVNAEDTPNVSKPKKARFKKKTFKKKFPGNRASQTDADSAGKCNLNMNHSRERSEREIDALIVGSEPLATETMVYPIVGSEQLSTEKVVNLCSEQLGTETVVNPQDGMRQTETEKAAAEGSLVTNVDVNLENGQSTASDSHQSNNGTLPPMSSGDTNPLPMNVNEVSGARDVDFQTLTNSSTMAKLETSSAMANANQSE
ncbi:Double-stranded RNA-binding domain containing protein [Parasponia andersonii]|uniref:Double-stranded RNA-binding domain containing protein n=1 Tax=Parasponia andersonii TaxID=3476 RepID=A0A2P5BLY7_PARAD|nr:Double-stranded RNA-binding domain containing protein [Parasponia andersonii]